MNQPETFLIPVELIEREFKGNKVGKRKHGTDKGPNNHTERKIAATYNKKVHAHEKGYVKDR